ncbi:hypothetical protein Murmansk-025 [Murmansk poxvirus]|uniref:Uncharacterized protein n=1 Tax=Murmansk poxvirus TaxID=2025359 RepID=A0A223FML3_9POXV|nr:hypothetical protein CKM52_gp025 [Murmansk poxvirus]AST09220.1 hypothetical protein Murmansk-025 [Murmansk poxvirus]
MDKITHYLNNITDGEFETVIDRSSNFLYLSDDDHTNITRESLALEIVEEYPNDCERILAILLLSLDKYISFESTINKPIPAIRFAILDKMRDDVKVTDLVKNYFRYLDKGIKLGPLFEKLDEYRILATAKYANELHNAVKYFNIYNHLIFYPIPKPETDYCKYIIGFLAALVKTIGYEKAFNKFVETVSVDDRRVFKKHLIDFYN